MATAADVITRALKHLGKLAAGETLSAEDLADGLVELNLLLKTWDTRRLTIMGLLRVGPYAAVSSPVVMGDSGDILIFEDPARIERLGIQTVSGGAETPLRLLSDAEYAAISDKATTGAPRAAWIEYAWPNANIHLWPQPASTHYLVLYLWQKFVATFVASSDVEFPPGYENALGLNLAIQMAPLFGAEPSAALRMNAAETLEAVRRINAKPSYLTTDAPALGNFSPVSGDS